jgi:hypothetical protein
VLDAGPDWAGEPLDSVELFCQGEAAELRSEVLGRDNDLALKFVDRFGAADQNTLSGD